MRHSAEPANHEWKVATTGKPEIPGRIRRHQSERRVEAAMHVDEVDALAPEQRPEVASKSESGR